MKHRTFILLLALLLSAQCSGCAATSSETENAAETTLAETTVETTEADLYAALLADVPTDDFGGFEFIMLNNESNFAHTAMTAEELTGEALNDALYNRSVAVSEKLNIVIKEDMQSFGDVTKSINTAITAGDDTYGCFWNESHFVAPIAIEGKLLNIHDIEAIDLTKPWWNEKALEDIETGEYQYFLVGDLHLMFKEAFWMVGFNKDIVDEVGLEDPYEKVREGSWTLDTMSEYMAAAEQDLDGNGEMDGYDRFGVTCYSGCVVPLFLGAGGEIIREENGTPKFIKPDDHFFAAYEKVVQTMFGPEVTYTCFSDTTKNISQYTDGWHGVFSAGHALFYLEPIGSLKKLRDMDAEFGIMPYPKYDENQENYITYIATYAALCGIPVTSSDPARTGVILENLCAQSHGELRTAYEGSTLNFKYIRDTESAEMLQLIFETGRFNLSDQLGVGTPKDTIMNTAIKGDNNIASAYAKVLDAANVTLEENLKKLMKEE